MIRLYAETERTRPQGARMKPQGARRKPQRTRMERQVYRWGAAGRGFGPGARKIAPYLGGVGCAWVSQYGAGREIARTAATIDGVYEGGPPGEVEGLGAADD